MDENKMESQSATLKPEMQTVQKSENSMMKMIVGLVIGLVIGFVVAYFLFSSSNSTKTTSETTPTPTVSVSGTDESEKAETKKFKVVSADISSINLDVEADLLPSEEGIVRKQEELGVFQGTADEFVVSGIDFELFVQFVFEIENPITYPNSEVLSVTDGLGIMSRFTTQENNRWQYTNDYSATECPSPVLLKPAEAPCGTGDVNIETQRSVFVNCKVASDTGLARCDEIIKSMKIKTTSK